MSGSLTRIGGENVPGIPGACATHNFTYLARGHMVHGPSFVKYRKTHICVFVGFCLEATCNRTVGIYRRSAMRRFGTFFTVRPSKGPVNQRDDWSM